MLSPTAEFIDAAFEDGRSRGHAMPEINAPASIIMLCEALGQMQDASPVIRKAAVSIAKEAEIALLQLALMAESCRPGSVWLNNAYSQGWRYRLDRGIHQIKEA